LAGLKAGLKAAPKGAVIAATTTLPFSMIRNALRVVRGEMSTQDAMQVTLKTTAIVGGAGGVTALTITTIAAASQPIAIALGAISPALLAIGGAGMVKEFFNILDNHKEKTKTYYESLTQQELDYLEKIEEELIYEQNKNMEFLADERTKNLAFLAESKSLNAKISNRPIESSIEGALKRYLEPAEIARSLGCVPAGETLLNGSQNFLASSED
jgi:hypothetical protein